MRKFAFLTLLLLPLTLSGMDEGLPVSIAEIEMTKNLANIEDQIFELQRKSRRYRLWARHYDREAKLIFRTDWNLYRKWLQRAEDNRQQEKGVRAKIFALEEKRERLGDSQGMYR